MAELANLTSQMIIMTIAMTINSSVKHPRYHQGYPANETVSEEEWNQIIKDMIWSFGQIMTDYKGASMDCEKRRQYDAQIQSR